MQVARILVPTDLSDFGVLALRHAEEFSAIFSAKIVVMHALEPPFATIPPDIPIADLPSNEAIRSDAEERLRSFVAEHSGQPETVEALVVEGHPVQAIVETARRIQASLLILGTHGRRGWRRALLGSVTERVLRETTIPLLVVSPLTQARREPRLKSILCPVNFSAVGQLALREASELAAAAAAELTVLHVSESRQSGDLARVERDLDAWVAPAVRNRCRYSQIVTHGNAAQRVLDVADELSADLLVIGAEHRLFSDGTVIGSTSERVVRFARMPVLTVFADGRQTAKQETAELAGAAS